MTTLETEAEEAISGRENFSLRVVECGAAARALPNAQMRSLKRPKPHYYSKKTQRRRRLGFYLPAGP